MQSLPQPFLDERPTASYGLSSSVNLQELMAKHDKTPGRDNAPQDDDLRERLDSLGAKLKDPATPKGTAESAYDDTKNAHTRAGVAQAFRLSSEFIAGVVVGAGIGYAVDTFFGTSPWGMIIFLMLGFGAAILNVMRAAGMVAESNMRFKPAHELQNTQPEDAPEDSSKK